MIHGIDVSNWQGEINWGAVAEVGCRFAFVKATEGATFQDKHFARNRDAAGSVGIAVGAYHYFRRTSSVPDQLNNFEKVVGEIGVGELPPVVDLEEPAQWQGVSRGDLTEMVLAMLRGMESIFGAKPIIYLSPTFAENWLDTSSGDLGQYDLWIAHWGATNPRVPKPWERWVFWQHTNEGRIPGIEGKVDLDWYFGENLLPPYVKR